ncbi:MAG: hypothetical protein COA42_23485 [Alteromonadaceae bacterium]|nr:MAG: hypothetical protein COA42_23485 [Alteromonadaceae bacterium]
MLRRNVKSIVSLITIALMGSATAGFSEPNQQGNAANYLSVDLVNTTQGPLWPPAAFMDENGDFVLVGATLSQVDGQVQLGFGQAAIVSKNTVPPLDENGVENFSNPFGAPYTILRQLDLSENSKDRDIKLYTNSYGPAKGDFGGGPRIPMQGESRYNLNGFSNPDGTNCPDIFPSMSQEDTFTRASFALEKAPIVGFMGDDVAYDVNTGEPYVPVAKNGSECAPFGCEGEDKLHNRPDKSVTLGDWLAADVTMEVKLINYDRSRSSYTAAKFKVKAENLLPNAIYTVVATRSSFLQPSPMPRLPHAASLTSHMITDEKGRGTARFSIENPFPARETDDAGTRIVAMALGLKSDYALLGGCTLRFGAGVDIHAVASTAAAGVFDFTNFVTVPKSEG